VGNKVGHSLASRAGSLLRGTELNDLSLSLPLRISFSMRSSLPLLQKCHKILWCPVVDNDLTTMHTCTYTSARRARWTPFFLIPFSSMLTRWETFKEQRNLRGENADQGASFSFSRSAVRTNFAYLKSPKIFTTFAFSLPRGQRSSRHLEQSPGVFIVSSSRFRRFIYVILSFSHYALYIVRASEDNIAPVVVIYAW